MSFAFLVVLSASLATNLYLARIVLSYRGNTAATNSVSSASTREANTRQVLTMLHVSNIDGINTRLNMINDRPTVIYMFSPTCSWCEKNLQNIQLLSAQAGKHYRFIGISTSSRDLRQYLAKNPLVFPVYAISSGADLKTIDFRGTPQTIVLSPYGVVEHNWQGAYIGWTAQAIQQYFSVNLTNAKDSFASTPLTVKEVR